MSRKANVLHSLIWIDRKYGKLTPKITIRKVRNTLFLLKAFIGAWYVPTFKTNFVAILQFFNYQGFK